MARQPRQVHIFLFREREKGYEYGIFQRSDEPVCWQGVCGGLEGDETLEEGARREIREEAGVEDEAPLFKLESISYLPDFAFSSKARQVWGKSVVVVPMYFFAMKWDGEIALSNEHLAMRWLCYDDAYDLVYYMDQKIALYELHEKLKRGILDSTCRRLRGMAVKFTEN